MRPVTPWAEDGTVTVLPSGAALGAEVCGVDLANPLAPMVLAQIKAAALRHIVLLFRDQHLNDGDLIAFGRRFGPLHRTQGLAYGAKPGGVAPEIELISNQAEDGAPPSARPSDECTWHTDMSMFERPASMSILYAQEVPAGVGQTRFTNLYRAYETLPEDLRQRCEGSSSIHDFAYTAMGELRAGFEPVTDKSKGPGARHPIVRTHAETGRRALFLGRMGYGYVPGLSVEDSDRLLDALWAHMVRPEHIWSHEWRNGDLVMWDNRCCAHSRAAFDPYLRRRLRRVTVIGERPA